MKKVFAAVTAFLLLIASVPAHASFGDVPESAAYREAVERVTSLGLMEKAADNRFKPDDAVTREQFAMAAAIAAGLGGETDALKGMSRFSDVAAESKYNGYINACIEKGLMTGLADGKFHPGDPVTFAQAATAMIRMLGYNDSDIPGTWPRNYIDKAKSMGLAAGLQPSAGSAIPRRAMAQMLDMLLDMKIRTADGQEGSKTLAEASGLTVGTMYTVYSKPEVYAGEKMKGMMLGDINLGEGRSIVRNTTDNSTNPPTAVNGEAIGLDELEDFNVVYRVSDRSGKNAYILVIDNKITGTLTGIKPDKFAPRQVEVDGKPYELDKYFNTNKLSGEYSFALNDEVTLLLGFDGKVVDMVEALYSDNSNFAFVINYTSITSSEAASYGFTKHTVKLLMPNGSINTFDTPTNPSPFKGKLVIYEKNPDGSVRLEGLNYSTPGEVRIDKENRRILSNYDNYGNDIAGNVKIFNFISNEDEVDARAEVISWQDLPSGVLPSGKVLFMNKSGEFEDINFILLNNVTAKNYKLGIVKSCRNISTSDKPLYNCVITIDGKDYTYASASNDYGLGAGSVVKVNLQGNVIYNILEVKYPDTQSNMIQATDKDRIRISGKTYRLSDDLLVYLIDSSGNVKAVDTSLLRTGVMYGNVAVYTDINYIDGGKAEMIIARSM